MAISTDELTVSAQDIMSRPLRQRQEMANRGLLDVMLSTLTPGQIAATFPSYVKDFTTGGPAKSTSNIPAFRGGGGTGTRQRTAAETKEALPEIVGGRYQGGPQGGSQETTGYGPADRKQVAVVKDIGNGLHLSDAQRKAIIKKTLIQEAQAQGYAPDVAARMAAFFGGNILAESEGNPTLSHDRGTGYGLYGARLERRDAMFAWMASQKPPYPKDSLVGQARYMMIEAKKDYPDMMKRLESVTDVREGAEIVMRDFEKPGVPRLNVRQDGADEFASINTDDIALDGTVTRDVESFFDKSEAQQTALINDANETATPLPNNSAEVPSDYVINYPRVVQEHIETADVRKLKLDEDLEKRIAWAADSLSNTVLDFENDNGYRNFEWVSKSGGQDETTGIPAGATKEGHWDGKGSDGYLVEIMPDGSRRTVTFDDKIVMGQFAEYLGQAGIKEVGGGYKGMGPNQLHLGTSGDSGVYSPKTLPDYITERYNEGREFHEQGIRVNAENHISLNDIIDQWAANAKKELQASREQNKTTQPIANPAASVVPQETIQAPNNIPAAAAAAIESQTNPTATPVPVKPAAPQPIATTPQTPQMIASLTGTSLLPDGAKAAAGGAEIDKPYFAQPVDGSGPNILMGETGPEKITPRNRADDFGMQQYQMPQLPAPEPAKSDIIGAQNFQQPQYLPKPSFAQEPSQTPIVAEHTPIPPSLRKQYADAKMQNRLDNLSPIGSVYSNFGYA